MAAQTKEVYESLNRQMVAELPKFVAARVPYLDPCFESLILAQIKFSADACETLKKLNSSFPEVSLHGGEPGSHLQGRVEGILMEMRELGIVGSTN